MKRKLTEEKNKIGRRNMRRNPEIKKEILRLMDMEFSKRKTKRIKSNS